MTRILLVTHAETDWSAERRYQGHSDRPLNATGRQQAQRLAQRLRCESFARLFASDLLRARETAAIVAGAVPVVCDARLRELNFGAWEGLTYDEAGGRFPTAFPAWLADAASHAPPGGETLGQLAQRVAEFADERLRVAQLTPGGRGSCRAARQESSRDQARLPARSLTARQEPRPPGEDASDGVLIVSHRGTLRVLLCLLLGVPLEAHWKFHLEPASLSVVCLGQTAAVETLNDTGHLREVAHAG